jgi:hypothetical protein
MREESKREAAEPTERERERKERERERESLHDESEFG